MLLQVVPTQNGAHGECGAVAQLNRSDTLPDRKSPGWLTILGLAKLTSAPDYTAHLHLYDGTFTESGAGMTATVYVRADKDELVVDVAGADPGSAQTAQLALWSGRSPQAQASGSTATLGETWTDSTEPGHTGNTYGSLGAITAGGQNVSASVVDSKTVKVSFTPYSDGSFRVIAAAPHWADGDAQASASSLLGTDASASSSTLELAHLSWWQRRVIDSMLPITSGPMLTRSGSCPRVCAACTVAGNRASMVGWSLPPTRCAASSQEPRTPAAESRQEELETGCPLGPPSAVPLERTD